MKQLHPIQLAILKKLLFAPSLRYTAIKPNREMENNVFDFHLDQLIKADLIKKGEKSYSLSQSGKEYSNRIDTDETIIIKQAKISAWIAAFKEKNNRIEFIISTRLKQPFYGCQGFLGGKVRYGEKVLDAAARELTEETGLVGKPTLVSIKHFLVIDKTTKEFLEDKFMYLCAVKNPTGKLVPSSEGKYEWVDDKNLQTYLTNCFEPYDEFRRYVDLVKNFSGRISFEEVVHETNKF